MSHLPDSEILEHIQSGDSKKQNAAFRQIYRDHYGKIESYVVKNNGTKDMAHDVFQDGIIVFFNKAKNGLEMTSAIGTYIYAVCRNIWLDRLRKSGREAPLDDSLNFVPEEDDLLANLIAHEKHEIIIQVLEKIGNDCQRIIYLYYFQKMKMKQLKEEFGLGSEQAAKNKKSQCMKKLRSMVRDDPYFN